MAIGRVIGGLAGLGLVGVGYAGLGGEDNSTRNDQGEIVEGGEVGAFRLRVGDCFTTGFGAEVESVEAVPCSQPHSNEVFDAFLIPGSSYPGSASVETAADTGCLSRFETFVGLSYSVSEYDLAMLYPTSESWAQLDDREVLCLISMTDGSPKVGTARGTAR